MCNFTKSNGETCKISPKKDLCHIHAKKAVETPVVVAAPIVEQKKQDSELIPDAEEIVETDIVPPTSMSPNSTSAPSAQPELPISGAGKSEPVKINCKPFFDKCKAYLKENATGTWHESYTIKEKGTEKYLHKPMRDMSLLRVEHEEGARANVKGARRFYWIYNFKDAQKFSDHVALLLHGECHEVFASPRTRMFLDIDLKLDEMEKNDFAEAMGYPLEEGGDECAAMDMASKKLAVVYRDAIAFSLEEKDALDDMSQLDWMATTRNRALDDDGFKISIHLITNLMLPHSECAAIATHVQEHVIPENAEPLGIPESITDLVAWAIDPAQYHQHGSLGLPYGTKAGNMSRIVKEYCVPGQSYFLTKVDMACIEDADMSEYNVKTTSSKPSLMSMKSPTTELIKEKSRRFFAIEKPIDAIDEDEIDAFANRKAKPVEAKPVEAKPVEAKPVEAKPKRSNAAFDMEDPFDGEEMPRPEETDDEGGVSQELFDFDLEEVRSNPELHDPMIYELCKLMSPSWFRDSKNTWNLSRTLYQMSSTDPAVMRNTYALIISHHGGEWFNQKSAISQYVSDGPSTGFAVMSLSKLKSIAGGSNVEGYKTWKATYEPEPIKEESTNDSDRKSKKPSVVLKGKIIDVVKDTYRREFSSGVIFQRKTDYYYTRKFADPREFLNHIFIDDEMYQMCSQSDHKELLHFIKDIAHPDFPFMKIDHSYMGFKNGVYCLDDATFREGDDIPKNIQVRVYYDIDWNVPVETPLLDAFFARQFNVETTEFIYFMLGRTLTKLKDKFDFMVMLFGLGGTGKSLLMNLLCYAFGPAQVGIFGSTFQDRFGLSEFATKQIVASDDMPRNIAKTLPKSDFLSMQSRGRISCPVKGKGSIEVDSWLIPTVINSNDMPNYSDTSGEIIRRIMIIHFDNAIPDDEKDVGLEDKIKATEFCAFIHRCRSTYLKYCKEYSGRNAYTFCPQHFLDSRDMLRGSSNESYQFAEAHIKYVAPQEGQPPAMIAKAELKKMFNAYIKEKYNLSRPGKQTLDLDSLVSADPRTVHSAVNVCKSCRKKHAKGCCDDYSRTNRSKAEFILNAMYSTNPGEY